MTFFPWENGEAKPSCRKLPRPCGAMRLDMWMCNERLLWNLEIVHVTMESINEVMIGFFCSMKHLEKFAGKKYLRTMSFYENVS
jgi:hypothetical protein